MSTDLGDLSAVEAEEKVFIVHSQVGRLGWGVGEGVSKGDLGFL